MAKHRRDPNTYSEHVTDQEHDWLNTLFSIFGLEVDKVCTIVIHTVLFQSVAIKEKYIDAEHDIFETRGLIQSVL